MDEYFDQIPESLRCRRDVSWTAKGVYAYLRRAVAAGFHPGARRIGDACGISKNTATKALGHLVSAGLIEHEAGVKGRRSRYQIFSTVPDSGTVEPSQDLTQTVPEPGTLNRDQPSQDLTHTVPESGTPTVPESGTPPSQSLGHIQSKYRVSNQSKSRAEVGNDSKDEFDLGTPIGVWQHFGAAFVAKHDSSALGMFTGAASQRARAVVAMGLDPATFCAEVSAYVAGLDWQPDDPWINFAANVGDWQRRAKAKRSHRRQGRAEVPNIHDRPPGDDPDKAFARFEQGAA